MDVPRLDDDTLRETRACVMGLGRFGGGAGAVRWLLDRGCDVTLTDTRSEDELSDALAALGEDRERLTLRLGGHDDVDLDGLRLLVVNPAVPKPWAHPFVKRAIESGVITTTEIRLALERVPAGVTTVGVTGTAGKSTTTTMLARALGAVWVGGRVHSGGNLGGALLDTLDAVRAGDALVVELSSAQLWWLSHAVRWTPDIALVTNLAPNHLDWHGDMAHYEASKRAIVGRRLVCFEGSIASWGAGAEVRTLDERDAQRWHDARAIRAPGLHNARNALLARAGALWALECAGQDPSVHREAIGRAISTFDGLDHRLRTLGWARGVRFVDDSKCTTPQGVTLALDAFEVPGVHLLCGGADKGVSLEPMLERASRCASVRCFGATASAIEAGVRCAGGSARSYTTLDEAVASLVDEAREGQVVLLSPGCASWDQFRNYLARAQAFREAVERTFGALEPDPNKDR